MSLPTVAFPTYTTKLPVTKKEVSYRPFLVKEQKILLLASESDDTQSIATAILSVAKACCLDDDVDVATLPYIDAMFLYLQLRSKSVGEIVDSILHCDQTNLKGEVCGNEIPIKIDLSKVTVSNIKNASKKIDISDGVGVQMKLPTFEQILRIESDGNESTVSMGVMEEFDLTIKCIDYIFDGDQVFHTGDSSQAEMVTFLESLTEQQFSPIAEFIESFPSLYFKNEHTCPRCKAKNTIELNDISDFF